MDKIIKIGERVLIYNYNPYNSNERISNNCNMGVVISNEVSKPYNFEELPWYERMYIDEKDGPFFIRFYTVLGDDGKEYYGAEGRNIDSGYFFLTIESRIKELNNNLYTNKEKIEKLEEERQNYLIELNRLKNERSLIIENSISDEPRLILK